MVNALIKENDLIEAIAECQGERNPNANTCIKLAAYYTILREMRPDAERLPEQEYSYDPPPEYESGTEFGQIIAGKDLNAVMAVVDEIMETLRVFSPRLYDAAMRKLATL
jgi:hypothetical protein